jgi:hypothetical protein
MARALLLQGVLLALLSSSSQALGGPAPLGRDPTHRTRLVLQLSNTSLPAGVGEREVLAALADSARVWSYPAVACSAVEISVGRSTRLRLVEPDVTNLVVFRTETWCHNERCGAARTFPFAAAAMTTLHPSAPGFVRGDIELNGVSYGWNASSLQRTRQASLRVVLTHEIGHLLGLRDACAAVHGKPAPASCADRDSIMFAPAQLDTPTAKDLAALCRLHPRLVETALASGAQRSPFGVGAAWVLALTLLALHLRTAARG